MNAENIIYIVPRTPYISNLAKGDVDSYELYLSEPSQVYLEVFECFGKVRMEASSSIEKVEGKTYDVKSSSPPQFIGDHLIINYELDAQGPLFLSMSTTDGITVGKEVESLYMIIPHVLP